MARPAELHGILAVDKPPGWTSHDVVARVRRIAGQSQVGHGGTLDPLATGLLPLGLGQGTRLLEYLSGGTKVYEATVCFGAATETYDAEGAVTEQAPWRHVTIGEIRRVLPAFTGAISQRPPMYSAIKVQGVALYRRARRGEQIDVPVRIVTIYRIDPLAYDPPLLQIVVECSAGTYIRSIANDLGIALDTRAHLASLRRLRAGTLRIDDAVSLERLSGDGGDELLRENLLALDRPVWALPAAILDEPHTLDVLQGRPYHAAASGAALCRAYGVDGRFLALLRYDPVARFWQPQKVFTQPPVKVS